MKLSKAAIDPLVTNLKELIRKRFVIVKECGNAALVNSLKSFLGSGEAETIALASELKEAEFLILDDLKARNLFRTLDIGKRLIGTIGVLKFMLARGIIEESADTIMNKLEHAGFCFKRDLFRNC